MKKLFLIPFLFLSIVTYGQINLFGGIGYRVLDSATYRASSSVTTAHTNGYKDIYFNAQATTKHWDIWNGSTYDHIFSFSGGGGGSGTVTSVGITAGTSGTDVNVSGSPITSSGSITLNIPDAGASARGVVTTSAQTLAGVKTFSSDPLLPDEAYDATAWNASLEPPTKNAVRDKIETLSAGSGASVFNVQNYGALGDTQTANTASVSSSSTTLTCTTCSFTSDDTGNTARVYGAGAAGVDLLTTITYVNSTTVTLADAASTSITDKVIEWGNDDTDEIQDAIDAAFAAGGGTVYFPNGIYTIAGALVTSVDAINPNCQIYIPLAEGSEEKLTIKFLGESSIWWPSAPFAAQELPTKGVILKSQIVGSGTTPSVFGSSFANDGFVDATAVTPIFENICVIVKSKNGTTHIAPKMSGFKLYYTGAKQLRNVIAMTESDPTESILPVDVTYGFWFSSNSHTDSHSHYDNCTASGFYVGFRSDEHDTWSKLTAYNCYVGLRLGTGTHPVIGTGLVSALWCKYGVEFMGNKTAVDFTYISEKWPGSVGASKWYDNTSDILFNGGTVNGVISGAATNGGGASTLITTSGTTPGGTIRINDYRTFPKIVVFGGADAPQTSSSGGTGITPGDATTNPAYVEINGGLVSGGADKGFPVLLLTHFGQSGTSNLNAQLVSINKSIAGADKRLWIKNIWTAGATNTSLVREHVMNAGTLTQINEFTPVRHNFGTSVYIGSNTTTPTAKLHLVAGTTAASTAPLKFTSGTNMTTPEAGAVEFDGTNYFGTASTTRYTFAKTLTATASLNFDLTSVNSQDLTITVTGAADGDVVSISVPNASATANVIFTAWVSATNTVTVRASRIDVASGADPASGTFRASVIKY